MGSEMCIRDRFKELVTTNFKLLTLPEHITASILLSHFDISQIYFESYPIINDGAEDRWMDG